MRIASLLMAATCCTMYADTVLADKGIQKQVRAGDVYGTIPHVVDGGNWKTTITLVNLDSATRRYKLNVYGNDGRPATVEFAGRPAASSFSGEIPRGGTQAFESMGTAQSTWSGWVELDAVGTDAKVGITAVFGTTGVPGRPDYEATVPGEYSLQYNGILPFDNTRGYVTSVALLNPGVVNRVTMPVTIYDESGTVLRTDVIALEPGHKIAFQTNLSWPETAGKRGTVQFQGGFEWWTALGFRFHPGGAFTTVNVMEP